MWPPTERYHKRGPHPTLYHRSYNLVTIRVMSHQVALGESSLAMVVTHENQESKAKSGLVSEKSLGASSFYQNISHKTFTFIPGLFSMIIHTCHDHLFVPQLLMANLTEPQCSLVGGFNPSEKYESHLGL